MSKPRPRSEMPPDYYATRAELHEEVGRINVNVEKVNSKIDRAEARIVRWTVGTIIVVGGLIIAAVEDWLPTIS